MEYLARKLGLAKWEPVAFAGEGIKADAIGADLRTANNTLSFWECSENSVDIDNVVLALALPEAEKEEDLNKIKLVKMDVVLISKIELIANGFKFEPAPNTANTLVKGLIPLHYDMLELSMMKLYSLACIIAATTRNDSNRGVFFSRIEQKKVVKIVKKGLDDRKFDEKQLGSQVKKDLGI